MAGQTNSNADKAKEGVLRAVASYLTLAVVWLFSITFVFQNFFIPSSSMASTLLVGDHVVVERELLAPPARWAPFVPYREIQRGDVVVFYKPVEEDGRHMIMVKRVIGVPGDRIHLRDGVVFLNGVAQREPYITPVDVHDSPYIDDFPAIDAYNQPGVTAAWSVDLPSHLEGGDLIVPPGQYFAMGDNREVSLDSRFWGFIPRENILGRPLFVYWSVKRPEMSDAEVPMAAQAKSTAHDLIHFFGDTRWSRTFHRVR